MDIVFKNNKLEEECNNQRLLVKKHGADRAKTKPDGGLDWTKVTAVKILGVEDTHE